MNCWILDAGTSVGSNAEEADGASSHADFIAKNHIALKEAKEKFNPLVEESDELVKILGKILHNSLRNAAAEGRRRRQFNGSVF
jgi:hypothetical protein